MKLRVNINMYNRQMISHKPGDHYLLVIVFCFSSQLQAGLKTRSISALPMGKLNFHPLKFGNLPCVDGYSFSFNFLDINPIY